jgi:hypothetical protein
VEIPSDQDSMQRICIRNNQTTNECGENIYVKTKTYIYIKINQTFREI